MDGETFEAMVSVEERLWDRSAGLVRTSLAYFLVILEAKCEIRVMRKM